MKQGEEEAAADPSPLLYTKTSPGDLAGAYISPGTAEKARTIQAYLPEYPLPDAD